MKKNSFLGTFLLATFLLLHSTSCKKDVSNETTDDNLSISENARMTTSAEEKKLETELLKDVRNATARFHSTTQAIGAGYVPDNHCVSVPNLGGMGYHWVNPSLVDPVFDPLKPEVVLYATGSDGELQLVAVEYIVINTGQTAPKFGNQPFIVGGTPVQVPHWSLHVWLYENNPSGIFVSFNPNISCP